MTADAAKPDPEFQAMQSVFAALNPLDEDARTRVLQYVASRLGLKSSMRTMASDHRTLDPADDEQGSGGSTSEALKFETFAELYDAAQPKSQPDKALVGGYWLQICQGAESFDGFSVNRDLKNLGHGVTNITSALDALKGQKPALALQLKKSGKSRQARKTYKITAAGIKSVEGMIGG
ncbi:hypothetical protein [Mesorhizobium sp. M2A.F.Ca.ET.043.02.1.1]|uniref:hypothetical protein n=1 Tax=Mesorhizobium sp. M2A.F.Ca.ET.043.02.1.1 TaxID=2493670 RepID=UPI000F7577AF|nr:hypothetical protein [Mesorhizobium sp. M2A.F.Ca.ET.043.02.1.1]AZO04334.1 hypothetical protein EJ068_15605 [Mesorhizobium sp. M2A.F.Ca.ET.043.02.1.1]